MMEVKEKNPKICDYVKSAGINDEVEILLSKESVNINAESTYRSTRKVRKYLKKLYLSDLKKKSICPQSNCRNKRLTLAEAHKKIYGVKSNNPILDSITIKDLRWKCRFSNKDLDKLISYFKECKISFDKEYTKEQFTSLNEVYYYINPKKLP